MKEVKGVNGGHLRLVKHKDFPDKLMVVVGVYEGETGEVFSRAELIKAIWPEGVEGLRGMVESWGYKAIPAKTLDNAKSALAMLEE